MKLADETTASFTHGFLVRKNRSNFLKGCLWLLAVDAMVFTLPWMVKLIVDRLQERPLPSWLPDFVLSVPPLAFVFSICCLYLGICALIAIGRYWWRVFLIWSTFAPFNEVRRKLFSHIQSLDRNFFKRHRVGDLLSALTTDTENMRMTLAIGSLMILDTIINFLFFPILLWQLDHSLTLIIVPPLVVLVVMAVLWSDRLSVYYDRVQEVTANLSGRAFEMASGIRVIKAFRNENLVHGDFDRESKELRDVSLKVARYQSIFAPGLEYALGLALVVVLILGGRKVIAGEMAVSNLIAFQLYLANMAWPMMAMGWFVQMYRQSKASERRIQGLVRQVNPLLEIRSRENRHASALESENLFKLESLSYSYGRGRPIFDQVAAVIPKACWVGLTGPVGSGKTTLLELLSRQRDPSSGVIRYLGQDLATLPSNEVADRIVYGPQEAFMFSRSIRDNVALGLEPAPSDEMIWSLLRDLSFDEELLKERGGLSVRLGERGVNLSGGQRQRLSLGRALVRGREAYLFDDVFSQVDSETEAKLCRSLRQRLPAGTSVVMVSQRIETLIQCDWVMVLRAGGVEFLGSTSEALKQSGFLQRLVSLQSLHHSQLDVSAEGARP